MPSYGLDWNIRALSTPMCEYDFQPATIMSEYKTNQIVGEAALRMSHGFDQVLMAIHSSDRQPNAQNRGRQVAILWQKVGLLCIAGDCTLLKCPIRIRVYKPDGTEYISAGGDMYIWDGCQACADSNGGKVDFSGTFVR